MRRKVLLIMYTRSQFFAELAARRNAAMSLQAIGDSLGLSKQAVSQWLSGKAKPSKSVLMLAWCVWRGGFVVPDPARADAERS